MTKIFDSAFSIFCVQFFFLACSKSFAVQGHFKALLSYPALVGIQHSVSLLKISKQ
jgi:hypothetical protein